jgi:hypothetical protein
MVALFVFSLICFLPIQSEKRIPSSVITINPKSKKSKHVLAVFSLWRGVLSALEFCSSVDLNDPFPAQLEQPVWHSHFFDFKSICIKFMSFVSRLSFIATLSSTSALMILRWPPVPPSIPILSCLVLLRRLLGPIKWKAMMGSTRLRLHPLKPQQQPYHDRRLWI